MFRLKLPSWACRLLGLGCSRSSGAALCDARVKVPHILEYSAFCDIGTKRSNNEDRYFINPTRRVFVVFDGMGGLRAGEVASATAAAVFEDLTAGGGIFTGAAQAKDDLAEMAAAAHSAIRAAAERDLNLYGMGTTLTGAAITEALDLQLVHAGDSRAYLLRNGRLTALTEDDTLVAVLLKSGVINEEQAKRHPMRNELSRYLGQSNMPGAALPESTKLMPGDTLLLCSDGLLVLAEAEIEAVLSVDRSAKQSCDELLRRALLAKARDNVTAIVIRIIAVTEKLDCRPQ